MIFSLATKGSLTTLALPTLKEFLGGHPFFHPVIVTRSAVPQANKIWIFCIATLPAKPKIYHFQIYTN